MPPAEGRTRPPLRFCMECGAGFSRTCAACGAKAPSQAKFCMACGGSDGSCGATAPLEADGQAPPIQPAAKKLVRVISQGSVARGIVELKKDYFIIHLVDYCRAASGKLPQ